MDKPKITAKQKIKQLKDLNSGLKIKLKSLKEENTNLHQTLDKYIIITNKQKDLLSKCKLELEKDEYISIENRINELSFFGFGLCYFPIIKVFNGTVISACCKRGNYYELINPIFIDDNNPCIRTKFCINTVTTSEPTPDLLIDYVKTIFEY